MRNLRRALLAGGLGFAVSLIASCGGGAGLLSGDQANTLNNQLNQVSADLAAGHCRAVRSDGRSLVAAVANLPSTINSTLRQDLAAGSSTVSQLAVKQCHPVSTTPTTTAATTTTTAPTTTATTTTTTPPPTQTHTTTTTTPTPPPTTVTTTGPSGGGGLGGGGGGGGGGAAGGALNGGGGG
jgi:hypothetical protein